MCGIAGIFSLNGTLPSGKTVIKKMTDSLAHRGPDDEGFYQDSRVALGFRRLSIIDLKTGNQPIHNEDSSVWTVLNGEIYNYRELRTELEGKGHKFYTHADTEVLVHLYEEYGEGLVGRLRGMFAFCIWDTRANKFCVFRDRLGIKPLFYAEAGGCLLFASEIKALLASGLVTREMDTEALNYYLGLQYVPAPLSIYKNIRKLKPGHMLSLVPKQREVRQVEYWDLDNTVVSPLSFEDCKARYRELLVESVKLHLMSDVPLGAFLSGGVDSSAVVATMAELCAEPVNTFTICSRNRAYDEGEYARIVSSRFGTVHRTFTVDPSDFLALIPGMFEQYDEPFADSSALPTYIVSRLARKHVTVALSGDGGDETCAGYSRYSHEIRFGKIERALKLRAIVPGFFKNVFRNGISSTHGTADKGLKYLLNLLSTPAERHLFFMSYFRNTKSRLYGEHFRNLAPDGDLRLFNSYMDKVPGGDILRKLLYLDQKTYLPDDILYKVDIASMANSLEVRVPLLDHKLVEFISEIPSEFKLRGGVGKVVFKEILKDKLPHDILYRKKKGFEIPVSAWFRDELAVYVKETLLSCGLFSEPYFNRAHIERMLTDHQSGKQDFGHQLWILMSLAVWYTKNKSSLSA